MAAVAQTHGFPSELDHQELELIERVIGRAAL